ncbi:cytochrome P450 [Candidatus Uabimicrobium sp. HlEnr_7]|uniref:cytochrome P450 n=1 Tax=Candidatus Uabimicrobium helgolandensis TaxID=3095367 RepID=UPI003558DB5F
MKNFHQDPVSFLANLEKKSPVAKFRLGPMRCYYISSLSGIEQVLKQRENYIKGGPIYAIGKKIIKGSLVEIDEERWKSRNKTLSPMFFRKKIESYFNDICACFEQETGKIFHQQTVDISSMSFHYTLKTLSHTVFGTAFTEKDSKEILENIQLLVVTVEKIISKGFFLPLWIPSKQNRELNASLMKFRSIVKNIIRHKVKKNSFIYDLTQAFYMDKKVYMNEQELVSEILLFFMAGIETTALTLSWTLHHLCTNNEIKKKFHDELDEVVGQEPLTLAKLHQLDYMEKIINESMRYSPAFWLISRYIPKKQMLDGHRIKAKSIILFSPYMLHHNKKYWKNSQEFIPERFAKKLTPNQKKAYIPFGNGPRICIGKHFAMMEIKIALAQLGKRFDFKLQEGIKVEKCFSSALVPKHNIHIEIKNR